MPKKSKKGGVGGMATATMKWTFDTTSQNWVGTPVGTGNATTFQAGSGNPAGCLSNITTGKNASGTGHWDITGSWITLFGIPAGSKVVSILASGDGYQGKCSVFTTGASSTDGPLELRSSVGGLLLTLVAGRTYSAVDGAFVTNSPGTLGQAVPTAQQPASVTVAFRLNGSVNTGASSSANNTLLQDNVTITITYNPPGYSYLCGFEMGTTAEPFTFSGTPTIQTSIVHGGKYALRCNPTASRQYVTFEQRQGLSNSVTQIFCSVRFYLYIASLPNVQTAIYSGRQGSTSFFQTLLLNTDGSLTIEDGVGVAKTTVPIAQNVWHQISINVNPNTNSDGTGTDGNSVSLSVDGALLATVISTSGNTIVYDTAWLGPGAGGATGTCTCDLYFDDVLFHSGKATIGAGQQVLLVPISDVARGNWTGGKGGTVNLCAAVANIPPAGRTPSLENDSTQINNGSVAAPNDYTATCQTYLSRGVSGTINATAAIVADGCEVTAPAVFGVLWTSSNPQQDIPSSATEFDYMANAAVVGAFPSLWNVDQGPVASNPSLNLASGPQVSVRKLNFNGPTVDVCFLGVYVDFLLPPVVPAEGFKPFWMG